MAVAGTPVMLRGRKVLKLPYSEGVFGSREVYFYRGFIVTTWGNGDGACFRPVEGEEEVLQYVQSRVGGIFKTHLIQSKGETSCIIPEVLGDGTENVLSLIDAFWETEPAGKLGQD